MQLNVKLVQDVVSRVALLKSGQATNNFLITGICFTFIYYEFYKSCSNTSKKEFFWRRRSFSWCTSTGWSRLNRIIPISRLTFILICCFSMTTVPAGHRAIIFDRFEGVKPNVYGEGIHFVIPLIQVPPHHFLNTTVSN